MASMGNWLELMTLLDRETIWGLWDTVDGTVTEVTIGRLEPVATHVDESGKKLAIRPCCATQPLPAWLSNTLLNEGSYIGGAVFYDLYINYRATRRR